MVRCDVSCLHVMCTLVSRSSTGQTVLGGVLLAPCTETMTVELTTTMSMFLFEVDDRCCHSIHSLDLKMHASLCHGPLSLFRSQCVVYVAIYSNSPSHPIIQFLTQIVTHCFSPYLFSVLFSVKQLLFMELSWPSSSRTRLRSQMKE